MKQFLKLNIYLVVVLISVLLGANIVITGLNNKIIEENRSLQQESEFIIMYSERLANSIIHPIDIGLRGFAIVEHQRFSQPMEDAIGTRGSIYNMLEDILGKQNRDTTRYMVLKDSIEAYVTYSEFMLRLLKENRRAEFTRFFEADKGGLLWVQYVQYYEAMIEAERQINANADTRYLQGLKRNYIFQVILFLICVPTLLYTAFHTRKKIKLSELLRKAHIEKNRILADQNQTLEQMVHVRTHEIQKQKEEIKSQAEEIAAQRDTLSQQNQELHEMNNVVELQNIQIQRKNEELEQEVITRTRELHDSNDELINQNHQLEQFAFMVAHNLRAPVARILGLHHLLRQPSQCNDQLQIIDRLSHSVFELDDVIHDLNRVLNIRKNTPTVGPIHFRASLNRVVNYLAQDIAESNAHVKGSFENASKAKGISHYFEDILLQLISNSIKYKHPERAPVISVCSFMLEGRIGISIQDNGLGIDLEQHQDKIFTLYKRFHYHVEGKGIGLYLVKQQVVAMGGEVIVVSALEEGTTFTIYLPPIQ